jgi:hypothetical protein
VTWGPMEIGREIQLAKRTVLDIIERFIDTGGKA